MSMALHVEWFIFYPINALLRLVFLEKNSLFPIALVSSKIKQELQIRFEKTHLFAAHFPSEQLVYL